MQIKDFFFREFCRFFRAELESLVSEFKSDCGIEIQKIQREAKRENRLYEITKEVLKEKNHIIVGIDTNKNGDEVLVVQWCFGNNVWFMLSRSFSDISAGISTSIPSLRTIIFCGTAGSVFSGSAPPAIHCVCTAAVVQVTL